MEYTGVAMEGRDALIAPPASLLKLALCSLCQFDCNLFAREIEQVLSFRCKALNAGRCDKNNTGGAFAPPARQTVAAALIAACVGGAGLSQDADAQRRPAGSVSQITAVAAMAQSITRRTGNQGSNSFPTAPAPRGLGSQVRVRGLVVPQRQATISAAFPATIMAIGPDNGGRFNQGDVLVEFDCGINQAELNRASALAQAARDTLRVRRKMAASGSISKLQVILAAAEYRKAEADEVVAVTRVSYCRILAPFSGRVVRRVANAFETVAPRDPLLEIVDDANVEIRVFVPSLWLKDLQPGGRFQFTVEETGETIAVQIIALGATIDNVSQLVEVRGRVVPKSRGGRQGDDGRRKRVAGQTSDQMSNRKSQVAAVGRRGAVRAPLLLAGMSGLARFALQDKMGGARAKPNTVRSNTVRPNTARPGADRLDD